MTQLFKNKILQGWSFCALLCACCTACSADKTFGEVEEPKEEIPMQFSQAVENEPVTRAASPLKDGFMVSCWKGADKAEAQEVMGSYEVKYKVDGWNNLSKWDYVGTTTDGYYKDQLQRYWDADAMPYRFYAITPCPAHAEIGSFTLDNSQLIMPSSAVYQYQTCSNGVVSGGKEPYCVAQVQCNQVQSYVAMPFRHLTSKVKILIYNNYKKEIPAGDFQLYNVKIKVASADFVKEGKSYKANLATGDILHGEFAEKVMAAGDEMILVQTGATEKCDLKKAVDKEHAYDCKNAGGLLQIAQKGVKLLFSFDVYGVEFEGHFPADNHVEYDKTNKIIHYKDVEMGTYDWEPNTINTYIIKVNEFYPLSIDFSAELTPWADVTGSIDTNLEK